MLSLWQQNGEENEKIYDYINSIGKYDSQTQINEANEFCETFRILKDYYQQYYTAHNICSRLRNRLFDSNLADIGG